MSEEFYNLAKKTFEEIFNFVEKNYQDFDIDYDQDNLVIEFKELTYILSIHSTSSQIWLSSPVSGAHHFNLKTQNEKISWISTRDESINLLEKLNKELTSLK